MPRQHINIGTTAGDKTGDKLRVGGDKINDNFIELYSALGNLPTCEILALRHVITESESTQLHQIHDIIPSPGAGKAVDLITLVARIIPGAVPDGGWGDVSNIGSLNVSMDGTTTSQLCGYFPLSFLFSNITLIQHMTPSLGSRIPQDHTVHVALSPDCVWNRTATFEFYALYRIVDTTGSGSGGGGGAGGGGAAVDQVVQSFTNQSEVQVIHNLQKYPTVFVIDTAGRELTAEIIHESTDQLLVRLNPAASGKIIYS